MAYEMLQIGMLPDTILYPQICLNLQKGGDTLG